MIASLPVHESGFDNLSRVLPSANLANRLRNKLKYSLTYSIYNGYFERIRILLESPEVIPTSVDRIDINETDEWWINNTSVKRRKPVKDFKEPSYMPPIISKAGKVYGESPQRATSSYMDKKLFLQLENLTTPKQIKTTSRTPLMLAAMIEDDAWSYTIAQNLLEKGACLNLRDSNGLNALMYACLYERFNLLSLYLSAPGDYDLLAKDNFGNTVLHLASLGSAESNCETLRKMFTKYGIDLLESSGKNLFGHTPIDLCRVNNHHSCISYYTTLAVKNKMNKKSSMQEASEEKAHSESFITKRNSILVNSANGLSDSGHAINPINQRSSANFRSSQSSSANYVKLNDTNESSSDLKSDSGLRNQSGMFTERMQHRKESIISLGNIERLKSANVRFASPPSPSLSPQMRSYYKYIYSLKEPLIKASKVNKECLIANMVPHHEPSGFSNSSDSGSSYFSSSNRFRKDFSGLNSATFHRDNYLIPHDSVVKLVDPYQDKSFDSDSITNFKKSQAAESTSTEKGTWRMNVSELFQSLELQKTKSFRKSHTNQSSNLFDQLSTGILLNVQMNPLGSNPASRRNSILKKPTSALSSGNNSNDRRQSVSSMKTTKSNQSSQKRTTIMTNS